MTPATWHRLPADLTMGARWIDGSGEVRLHLRAALWVVVRDGTEWEIEAEAVEHELATCAGDLPW